MHEMSLMGSVLDAILDECEGRNVAAVTQVKLIVGEQRDIIEDYAQGLFQFLAKGTIAEGAELVIDRVPFRVRCTECDEVFKIDLRDPRTWSCPKCGAHQKYRVFSGHEFVIDSIEVDFANDSQQVA